jgi:hypothetical protein
MSTRRKKKRRSKTSSKETLRRRVLDKRLQVLFVWMHECTVGDVFDEKMQKKVGENARAPSELSLSASFATTSIAATMLRVIIARSSAMTCVSALENVCCLRTRFSGESVRKRDVSSAAVSSERTRAAFLQRASFLFTTCVALVISRHMNGSLVPRLFHAPTCGAAAVRSLPRHVRHPHILYVPRCDRAADAR